MLLTGEVPLPISGHYFTGLELKKFSEIRAGTLSQKNSEIRTVTLTQKNFRNKGGEFEGDAVFEWPLIGKWVFSDSGRQKNTFLFA